MRTWPFFLATFVISWGLAVPALLCLWGVLPGPHERFLPLVGLGGFGPLLAATLVSYGERRGAGVRTLFRGLGIWRVGAQWYALALFSSGAIFVACMAVRALLGVHDESPWLYPPRDAQRIVALVVFSVGEELGFRGFALPRLQRRWDPLRASLWLGFLWGIWHTPMMLLVGVSPVGLLTLVPFFMLGSVMFTWIFNHARQSTLVAVLTHAGAHLNNPQQVLPNLQPTLIHLIGYAVVVALLLRFDRRAWSPLVSATT
ncbi:MAG: CPBP family intramembrane metalloprotease [Polyangiaceae bacterium]